MSSTVPSLCSFSSPTFFNPKIGIPPTLPSQPPLSSAHYTSLCFLLSEDASASGPVPRSPPCDFPPPLRLVFPWILFSFLLFPIHHLTTFKTPSTTREVSSGEESSHRRSGSEWECSGLLPRASCQGSWVEGRSSRDCGIREERLHRRK